MHFIILDQCLEAYSCKNIYQKWMQTQSTPLPFIGPVWTFATVQRSSLTMETQAGMAPQRNDSRIKTGHSPAACHVYRRRDNASLSVQNQQTKLKKHYGGIRH